MNAAILVALEAELFALDFEVKGMEAYNAHTLAIGASDLYSETASCYQMAR